MTVYQSPPDSPAGLYTLISVHSSPAAHWQAMGRDKIKIIIIIAAFIMCTIMGEKIVWILKWCIGLGTHPLL